MTILATARMLFIKSVYGLGLIADDFQEKLFEVALMLLGEIIDVIFNLEFAFMQNGHAIANRFDFAEFMRREENCFAFVLQPLNDFADFHSPNRVEAAG